MEYLEASTVKCVIVDVELEEAKVEVVETVAPCAPTTAILIRAGGDDEALRKHHQNSLAEIQSIAVSELGRGASRRVALFVQEH
jgi:hypothetical protein